MARLIITVDLLGSSNRIRGVIEEIAEETYALLKEEADRRKMRVEDVLDELIQQHYAERAGAENTE